MLLTSDAGLLAYRELNDVLGLMDMVACELRDNRTGKNTQHSVKALLMQSVCSRLTDYEDTNDAERLTAKRLESQDRSDILSEMRLSGVAK